MQKLESRRESILLPLNLGMIILISYVVDVFTYVMASDSVVELASSTLIFNH